MQLMFISTAVFAQVLSNSGAVMSVAGSTTISNVSNLVNTSGTIDNAGALVVTSDVTNNATIQGNGSYYVGGNFTNNSTFTAGNSNVIFEGTTAQTINGSSTTTFNDIDLNNSNGLNLSTNTSVAGTLNFTSGVVNTGSNKISITSTGSIVGAGTSKFVNGYLEKYIPAGAGVPMDFEVGTGTTDYLPLNFNFASVTGAGTFTARANNGDHASIGSSCIDPTKSVNRHWNLSNTGTTFTNYSVTSNFLGVPTDADAGSNTANYVLANRVGGIWSNKTMGTLTATSSQATGVTTVGDIIIGEQGTGGGSVTFALGGSSTRCRAAGTVTYSASATSAISYSIDATSSAAGNSINAVTGEVTYISTYSGTTTITASALDCSGNPVSATHTAVSTFAPGNPGTIAGIGCVVLGSSYTYSITAVARASNYVWTVPTGANITGGAGTNSITVDITGGFQNGIVTVNPQNTCGASVNTSSKNVASGGSPAKPSSVSGPVVVCSYIGTGTATYSVTLVPGATSYTWTKPTGAVITSGQGTSVITVTYTPTYVSGQFNVVAANGCGSSSMLYFSTFKTPQTPVSITGIANVYGKTDGVTLVNYTTPIVEGVTSYNWTVPANVAISSGQGTNSVNLTFAPAFTGGNIGVANASACGTSSIKTKAIANNTTTPLSERSHYMSSKNISCKGLSDGEASIEIDGDIDDIEIVWNTTPIQNGAKAVGLAKGVYKVKVTSATGQSFVDEVEIFEPEALLVNALRINNSNYGESTGRVYAQASGGAGEYTYSWNNSSYTEISEWNNIPAGLYTVNVKDKNKCTVQASVTVVDSIGDLNSNASSKIYPVPAVSQFTIEHNIVNQNGGMIYVYTYDGKELFNHQIEPNTSARVTVNCATWSRGMYYIIVKDNNGVILSSKNIVLVNP